MTRLNPSPEQLLADASSRYRIFAAEQFPNPSSLNRQLQTLVSVGALQSAVQSVVLVQQVECIHIHSPGDERMDWERLASELHRRWSQHEARPLTIYWASRRTVNLLGGCMPGRISHLDAVTHDLGVTALALRLFAQEKTLREAWVAEELFADVYSQAKPDGALADNTGVRCLLEFAGRYTAERLSRLATLADRLALPLQFWTVSEQPDSSRSKLA